MILTLIIALITFVSIICSIIFFPKLKIGKIELSTYWIVAFVGAFLMVSTLRVDFSSIFNELFDNSSSINPIKILILFFSMTFISVFLEEAGFFQFLSSLAAKKAGKKQVVLFASLYILVSILTIFTSNDIVILTFTPFICYFCKHSKINPLPYVIAEFAAANTWSMMLIIGNPTNMYLGSIANIDFIRYFNIMLWPTVAAGAIEFLIIFLIFHKNLLKEIETSEEMIPVKDCVNVIVGLIHLVSCLVLLTISNLIRLPIWEISAVLATSLLIYMIISSICKKTFKEEGVNIVKILPWELVPFVISMFVIVITLNHNGISDLLRNFLGTTDTIWTYGPSSYLFANLINNIPMSILYSSLPQMGGTEQLRATFASIIGSNVGAFLTPIGALAGIMFNSLLTKQDIKLSFKQFSFYGFIISVPTFVVALFVLSLVL